MGMGEFAIDMHTGSEEYSISLVERNALVVGLQYVLSFSERGLMSEFFPASSGLPPSFPV
jgi:hypothetical protein